MQILDWIKTNGEEDGGEGNDSGGNLDDSEMEDD
jgi:hypothetical protein